MNARSKELNRFVCFNRKLMFDCVYVYIFFVFLPFTFYILLFRHFSSGTKWKKRGKKKRKSELRVTGFVVWFVGRSVCVHLELTASTLKKSLVFMMAHSTWHIQFTSRTTIVFLLIYFASSIFLFDNVTAQIEKQPWYEALPAVAMDYKVHLPAGKEDCYYQYVQQGATLYVSFQVIFIQHRYHLFNHSVRSNVQSSFTNYDASYTSTLSWSTKQGKFVSLLRFAITVFVQTVWVQSCVMVKWIKWWLVRGKTNSSTHTQ